MQTQTAKLDAALLHTMTTFIVTTFVKLQKAPIMTLLLYSKKVIQLFCVMNRLNYTPFVMPSPAAFRSNMAPLQLRLIGNAWLLTTFLQNVPIHAFHCSFQVKWTLVAVKHQQLLFLFTQIMIRGIASNIYFLFFAQFLAQYCVLTIKHVYHSAWFVN